MCFDGFYLTKSKKLPSYILADQLQNIWGLTSNFQLNLSRVIIHVGTNDLRSSQDPQTIEKSIIDIAKNAKNNKKDILILGIVSSRENSIEKGHQVNKFLEKPSVKNNNFFEILQQW